MLTDARSLFPTAQKAAVLLATALAAEGKECVGIDGLVSFWRQGVAEEGVYVCLGWLYQRTEQPAEAITVLSEGLSKYPLSLGILNNLGYTFLMAGDVGNARKILKQVPKEATPHVELIATFGLLKFWEGDIAGGIQQYREAEKAAGLSGRNQIVKRVRQKKHLELARVFLRQGDREQAVREAQQGLQMPDFPLSYRDELDQLMRTLELGATTLRAGETGGF